MKGELARMARGAAAGAMAVLLAGCTARIGTIPALLGPQAYPPAMVLATGARGRDCGTSIFLVPLSRPALDRALAHALATEPEATLLTDVRVEATTLVTGVYNRTCLLVHGSPAKLVSRLVVPAPEGHHGAPGHRHGH